MRRSSLRPLALACVVPMFAFVTGCNLVNGDDSPGDGTATEDASDAQDDIAEGVGGTAVDMFSGMMEAITLVEAPPGTARDVSTSWSEADGEWTITATDLYDEGDASGDLAVTHILRITTGGAPQQHVDDFTDRIEIESTASNVGNFHPPGRRFDVDYNFQVVGALTAVMVEGIVSFDGTGTLDGSTTTHVGDLDFDGTQDGAWAYDLEQDTQATGVAGCPSGTMTGTMNHFSFSGALSEGMATWELRRNGDLIRTLTESYDCPDDGSGSAS